MNYLTATNSQQTHLNIVSAGLSTGKVLSDLTITSVSNAASVSSAAATLSCTLTEIASGHYVLALTPTSAGTLYIKAVHSGSGYSEEFSIRVHREGVDLIGTKFVGAVGDYVFTATDASSNPVEGALVRVYDSAGSKLLLRQTTNSSGKATFGLPTGTYKVRTSKSGYDFSAINPTTITVSANANTAPVLSELVPSSAASGATMAVKGMYFSSTSEVLFGAAAVSSTGVSADGDMMVVAVPSGITDATIGVKVRKPDPDNVGSYLTSASLTLGIA